MRISDWSSDVCSSDLLGPGKRCLMNVCPFIGEIAKDDGGVRRFALGASGGRKIMPAVAQLASFLADFGMGLEDAFHHPRIDASGGDTVIADDSLQDATLAAARPQQPELGRASGRGRVGQYR